MRQHRCRAELVGESTGAWGYAALQQGAGINVDGQYYYDSVGGVQASKFIGPFMMEVTVAVPEPSTSIAGLVSIGLAGLAFLRRRK